MQHYFREFPCFCNICYAEHIQTTVLESLSICKFLGRKRQLFTASSFMSTCALFHHTLQCLCGPSFYLTWAKQKENFRKHFAHQLDFPVPHEDQMTPFETIARLLLRAEHSSNVGERWMYPLRHPIRSCSFIVLKMSLMNSPFAMLPTFLWGHLLSLLHSILGPFVGWLRVIFQPVEGWNYGKWPLLLLRWPSASFISFKKVTVT